jgi:hypothetical protein
MPDPHCKPHDLARPAPPSSSFETPPAAVPQDEDGSSAIARVIYESGSEKEPDRQQ